MATNKDVIPEEVKGYPTFFDVEDEDIRTHNRACVLANMAENSFFTGDTKRYYSLAKEYLSFINDNNERVEILSAAKEILKERGFEKR